MNLHLTLHFSYGIGVISIVLSKAIEMMMTVKTKAIANLQEAALEALLDGHADNTDDKATKVNEDDGGSSSNAGKEPEKAAPSDITAKKSSIKNSCGLLRKFLGYFAILLIFAIGIIVMSQLEAEPGTSRFVHAFYWLVITGTTVGYGDLYPVSTAGKWFCIVYLIVITATVAQLVSKFADWVTKEDDKSKNVKRDLSFNEELLDALDLDGNKKLSKWEWLAGMLVRLR